MKATLAEQKANFDGLRKAAKRYLMQHCDTKIWGFPIEKSVKSQNVNFLRAEVL